MDLTHNQRLVYECLQASQHALSAYDILDSLRAAGVKAPAQIYRALNKLIELELVHRIESLNAFVACEHADNNCDSILAVCDNCGIVSELEFPHFAQQLRKFGDRSGFSVQETVIELKGYCADCEH